MCYQFVKRLGVDALRNGRDWDLRIDRLQRDLPRVRLRRANALGRVQNLSLQVGQIDRVAIDQNDRRHAG